MAQKINKGQTNGARGVLDYGQKASDTSISTTPAVLVSLAGIVVPAGRLIKFTGHIDSVAGTGGVCFLEVYRDSTLVGSILIDIVTGGSQSGGEVAGYDTPGAGTYTYELRAVTNTGTGTIDADRVPTQFIVEDIGAA